MLFLILVGLLQLTDFTVSVHLAQKALQYGTIIVINNDKLTSENDGSTF